MQRLDAQLLEQIMCYAAAGPGHREHRPALHRGARRLYEAKCLAAEASHVLCSCWTRASSMLAHLVTRCCAAA